MGKYVVMVFALTVSAAGSAPVETGGSDGGEAAESRRGEAAADDAPAAISVRYGPAAERIIAAALAGNDAYAKLQHLCDKIGFRLSGSPGLDEAVRWAAEAMRADGLENVRLEPVMVPHWERGAESLVMVEPKRVPLAMLGLGGSVGTPEEGITAPVVVVADEEEFEALGEGARGKIVLFNNPMPPYDPQHGAGYGHTVRFRGKGARIASEKGAVACLIRSVTARSLRSPHTGAMRYGDAKVRIPAAAISTEDADSIARLAARGVPITVTLKMEARTLEPKPSANVVGELRGRTDPHEIVVIGGHIDAWDVGQGAHDDGAGCVMAMEAAHLLRRLNMIPRRTIRVVLWTNEENGLGGAKQYASDHAEELAFTIAAIEADSGSFQPIGYTLESADEARTTVAAEQMRDLVRVFSELGSMEVSTGRSGADLGPMKPAGVVLLGHEVEGSRYFDYHHSHADTLDKVDPQELSQNVAMMAATAYILAEMPERLGGGGKP